MALQVLRSDRACEPASRRATSVNRCVHTGRVAEGSVSVWHVGVFKESDQKKWNFNLMHTSQSSVNPSSMSQCSVRDLKK